MHVINGLMSGADPVSVLTSVGAMEVMERGRPRMKGPAWSARRLGEITDIELWDYRAGLVDPHGIANYTWWLSNELTRRFGQPVASSATSEAGVIRLFRSGDYGIQVEGNILSPTVRIGPLRTVRALKYGR